VTTESVSRLDCSSDSSQSIQSFAPSPIISSTLYTRSPISQIYVLACQAWQPISARSRELNSTAVPRSLRRRVYETVKRPSVRRSVYLSHRSTAAYGEFAAERPAVQFGSVRRLRALRYNGNGRRTLHPQLQSAPHNAHKRPHCVVPNNIHTYIRLTALCPGLPR